MKDAFYRWTNRRNTGMRLTWAFTAAEEIQPDYEYVDYNSYFIQLANLIHERGLTEEMEDIVEYIRTEKQQEYMYGPCSFDGDLVWSYSYLTSNLMENVSMEAIYWKEISENSLERAADIYFGMTFCPDYHHELVQFYQNLLQSQGLETILKTLANILFEANRKNQIEKYNTAKAIFDKITTIVNLQYKDFASLTMSASQLKLYQEMESHKLDPDFNKSENINQVILLRKSVILGFWNSEELINHPVHISDQTSLGTFIPFCSLGDHIIGRQSGHFQEPVCHLFREKIVRGQLCYEADINKYKVDRRKVGFVF